MPQTNRRTLVISLALSMFLAAMEMTAVSTAMPTVIGDLGDIHFYSWVFTSYMLTSTVTVPIFGKLSDIYGRKPLVLMGIFVFVAGSALCGLSTSIFQLIVFRAIQGLGAGALMPIALTIVGDVYPLEQRGKIQAVFSSVWGVSGIIGPLLGAMIVKYLNWRWVFYINLPFGIAAMSMIYLSFHENIERSRQKLDIVGGVLLTAAVVCLLLAAHGDYWVEYSLAGLFLLGFFVGVEMKVADPILPMQLFKKKLILVASISSAMLGTIMFASLTYLPLFVQGAMNGTPTDAGTVLTPMIVGWPIAGAIAGRLIVRYSFRPFILAGAACNFLGAIILATAMQMRSGYGPIYLGSCIFGIGLGLTNTALIIAVQTFVDWRMRGVATASTMFFRTIGGTLAVGVLGGLLIAALTSTEGVTPEMASSLLAPHGQAIPTTLLAKTSDALASGLVPIFWIIAGCAGINLLVSWQFPRRELKPGDQPAVVAAH